MAHTVQSFIDTLRADGVEMGRKAAEQIRREAEEQAEQAIHEAEAKASRIIDEAEQQRARTVERTRTDLELAARDTVLRLRDALGQALNRVLTRAVSETLEDVDFLKGLIRDIAYAYAQSDATGEQTIELNVSEPMRRKLADWTIAMLHESSDSGRLSLELHGALSTAGFEYKRSGETVEVTSEAVVEVLSQIVTPALRELIDSSQEGQAAEQT